MVRLMLSFGILVGLRLGDDRRETGVVRRIAASAFLNGNDHFTGDLGERL